MLNGERVTVIKGSLRGMDGRVIKDERYPDSGVVTGWRDRIWVLLDAGHNPQRFAGHELKAVR